MNNNDISTSNPNQSTDKTANPDDDGPPLIIKKKSNNSNSYVVYSCRLFYFTIYSLYYFCGMYYPSQISNGFRDGDYAYLLWIFGTHFWAAYFFMTAGSDPGWADEHGIDNVPSDDIDRGKQPTLSINGKNQLFLRAYDSSYDHLKLSSDEDDSETEEEAGDSTDEGGLSVLSSREHAFEDLSSPVSSSGHPEKRKWAHKSKAMMNHNSVHDLESTGRPSTRSKLSTKTHHSSDTCPKTIVIPRNRGCEFCRISVLPYRAKHCKECNRCVRKYDHHCFWIGGCVGELNHRSFYGFIFL